LCTCALVLFPATARSLVAVVVIVVVVVVVVAFRIWVGDHNFIQVDSMQKGNSGRMQSLEASNVKHEQELLGPVHGHE
jgi:hypothetical protein